MKNNSTKSSNRKINWKKVGIILLIILAIISVFGIIFSSLSFAKDIDNNNSRDIGDKLQITYNVSLNIEDEDKKIVESDSTTLDEKNSAKDRIAKSIESQLRNVSNSFYEQAKRQDINDFEITYGVPRHNSFSFDQDGNPIYQTFPDYGEVNLILSANDPGLDFNETIALSNYADNEIEIKKDANSSLTQQLKYFYRFANTYDLKLINLTKSEDSNYGLKPFYQLNKDSNVVYDSKQTTGTIKLDDRVDTTEYGKNWNFKELQEEFVKVVDVPVDTSSSGSDSSDGTTNPDGSSTPETPTTRDTETTTYWQQSDYDDEKAATSFLESKQFTEAPKNQYIIWNDRSDLIFRLQMSTLAAKLWNIAREFEANSKLLFIATNLIKSLSIYEQDFGFWLANNNSILIDLINQNSLSPSYWNGSSNPRNNDNLLRLLNEYYGTTGISVPDDSSDIQLSDEDKKTITEYKTKNQTIKSDSKFLYSWNLESNELIKKSLISIDYGNFFKFFENNNSEWIGEDEEKSTF
ncbi:MAG: hypothetical protein K2L64_02995, partial [Ureaplasma sp.]|nr:hypothetical protein [Ureaplasma sp.]